MPRVKLPSKPKKIVANKSAKADQSSSTLKRIKILTGKKKG